MAKTQKPVITHVQQSASSVAETKPAKAKKEGGNKPIKADQIIKLLRRKNGASLSDLQKSTGWQAHSVRGFLSGLRKRGLKVERITTDGQKAAYHITGA